jgi:hypothetical protein
LRRVVEEAEQAGVGAGELRGLLDELMEGLWREDARERPA